MRLVRRIPAIVLLTVFSVSLSLPALPAGTDSNLPACCRREGMHHCATPGTASTGASIVAVCPAFPKTGATPAHSKIAAVRPAAVIAGQIAEQAAGLARRLGLVHSWFARERQKRGPPALLS